MSHGHGIDDSARKASDNWNLAFEVEAHTRFLSGRLLAMGHDFTIKSDDLGIAYYGMDKNLAYESWTLIASCQSL